MLHVGEVHAELRLHITDDTLHDLGSQIATMIANAAREGFDAGMAAAMAEMDEGGALPPDNPARNAGDRAEPVLTDEDLRRARGE